MTNTIRLGFTILLVVWASTFSTGCASVNRKLKSLLGSGSDTQYAAESPVSTPRFSESDNVPFSDDRKYRRMTRDRFEEEAEVAANAGSLWVMEGQGAYLFAQNRTRLVGDLLNVKIDGAPKNQLLTKTRVISKLLERLDGRSRMPASAAPAAAPGKPGAPTQAAAPAADAAAGADAQGKTDGAPGAAQAAASPAKPEANFGVETVPTRIVEVLRDGSYKVRGTQDFMIGKREYRAIVTGIVRQEDFNEEGISADKLMDSQFDIVSAKRGASNL